MSHISDEGVEELADDVEPDESRPGATWVFRWWWLAIGSSLVVLWSVVRGLANGYQPVGDNGLLELRARDVFTSNHPLLGTGSSASVSAGIDVNHPGPLLFDLMAVPIRLFGTSVGIALAIAAFHILTIWLIGIVVARSMGNTFALVSQVVTAGIIWTLGSEMLYDPWQPNLLVLPFWFFACCVWAVSSGAARWLPLAVGYGSFAMQTHLSYAVVVPCLLVFALATLIWRERGGATLLPADVRRPLGWSGVTMLVLWAQPLWEQAFGAGRGNVTRLVIAGTGGEGPPTDSVTTGLSLGARILAAMLALPPWWGRFGYDDAIPGSRFGEDDDGNLVVVVEGLPSVAGAVVGLALLFAVIGLAWWGARRVDDTHLVAGFRTLAVLLVVAVVTVVITPIDVLGLSPHKLRWLWVVGAFATLLLLLTVVRLVGDARRQTAVAAVGAIGVLALFATLPTHANESGPVAFGATEDAVGDLRDQVAAYLDRPDSQDRFVFDADGVGFGEPYTSPIIAELAEQGIDFVVPDLSFTRQVGDGRRDDGDVRRAVMFVRVGQDSQVQAGAERVAFHDGEMTNFSLDAITDRAVGVFVALPSGAEQ